MNKMNIKKETTKGTPLPPTVFIQDIDKKRAKKTLNYQLKMLKLALQHLIASAFLKPIHAYMIREDMEYLKNNPEILFMPHLNDLFND